MQNYPPCEQTCTPGCETTCPQHQPPLVLKDVLERRLREATSGVYDTGRYQCRYHVWGSGPPLVFLHGLAGTRESFLLPMALLSPFFRCIAYDFPTGADDAAVLKDNSFDDHVSDLWALLGHLNAERCYLLASSFGSVVALAAMRAHPERLPRVVLHAGIVHLPLNWWYRCNAWFLRRMPRRLTGSSSMRRKLLRMHGESFAGRDPEIREQFVKDAASVPVKALGYRTMWMHKADARGYLPELRQPVLLLEGERDPYRGRMGTEQLLNGLPNAGRAVLEGCGHYPQWTHPELLARLVKLFLTPPAADGRTSLATCQHHPNASNEQLAASE